MTGTTNPGCVTVCLEGLGCLEVSTIGPCVNVPADSCISVALPPPSPPEVCPGETLCLQIPVTNCGNVSIPAGQTLATIGDFVPALPGGEPIPCGESRRLERELPIGATDTLEVWVPVAAGAFCGTYCAPLVISAGAAGGSANEICFVLRRCLEVKQNPVRYARHQSVDIASIDTGVAVYREKLLFVK